MFKEEVLRVLVLFKDIENVHTSRFDAFVLHKT